MHDLVRLYAIELADRDARPRTTPRRLLDHYLHTAHGAALLLSPHREPLAARAPRDRASSPCHWPTWTRRWPGSPPSIRCCWPRSATPPRAGHDAYAHALPWTLATYFDRRGHWRDWVAAQHIAVAAAQRLGDCVGAGRRAAAAGQRVLQPACLRRRAGPPGAALDLFDAHGDDAGRAHTHFDIALLYDRQSRPADALPHAGLSRDVLPGGRQPARRGDRAERDRLVPLRAGRVRRGGGAMSAGARDHPGGRQPLRRGEHPRQHRVRPPPPRPIPGGDRVRTGRRSRSSATSATATPKPSRWTTSPTRCTPSASAAKRATSGAPRWCCWRRSTIPTPTRYGASCADPRRRMRVLPKPLRRRLVAEMRIRSWHGRLHESIGSTHDCHRPDRP